jgi:hypothetical protein
MCPVPPSVMLCPRRLPLERAPTHRNPTSRHSTSRYRAGPVRGAHAETPDAAEPIRSTLGLGAGMRPGQAAALGGRAQFRFRPLPGEAGWTCRHVLGSQCTYERAAAGIGRSFHCLLYPPRTSAENAHGANGGDNAYSAGSAGSADAGSAAPGDAAASGGTGDSGGSGGWASERMSIRHPVSLAASRAFCPSLPIARDSW